MVHLAQAGRRTLLYFEAINISNQPPHPTARRLQIPRHAAPYRLSLFRMSMFRSKKLDLGGFVNIKIIRDHTKRKVFAEHEPERYDAILAFQVFGTC